MAPLNLNRRVTSQISKSMLSVVVEDEEVHSPKWKDLNEEIKDYEKGDKPQFWFNSPYTTYNFMVFTVICLFLSWTRDSLPNNENKQRISVHYGTNAYINEKNGMKEEKEENFKFIPNVGFNSTVRPIDIITDATKFTFDEFYQNYYLKNKPVLIKNGASHVFTNARKWTTSWIQAYTEAHDLEDERLRMSCSTGRLVIADCRRSIKNCLHPDQKKRCVHFQSSVFNTRDEFVVVEETPQTPWKKELLNGIKPNSFAFSNETEGKATIYVSNHGGALPHSHSQRFNILTEGKKRWILVNPLDYARGQDQIEFEDLLETNFRPLTFQEYATGKPNNKVFAFSGRRLTQSEETHDNYQWWEDVVDKDLIPVPHYDFVQEAGDFFFLPSFYTHATIDLTKVTMGVVMQGAVVDFNGDTYDSPTRQITNGLPPQQREDLIIAKALLPSMETKRFHFFRSLAGTQHLSIRYPLITFIHVGKTGGQTVQNELRKHLNPRFKSYHRRKVNEIHPDTLYVTWIRNPIDRFVSAFYWRYYLIKKSGKARVVSFEIPLEDELAIIEKYGTPNNLAELLFEDTREGKRARRDMCYIGHVCMDVSWYLNKGEFLREHQDQFLFVGMTEHLQEDMAQLSTLLNMDLTDIAEDKHVNDSSEYDKTLSPKAKRNLAKFFSNDYRVFDIMVEMGLLDARRLESYRI